MSRRRRRNPRPSKGWLAFGGLLVGSLVGAELHAAYLRRVVGKGTEGVTAISVAGGGFTGAVLGGLAGWWVGR